MAPLPPKEDYKTLTQLSSALTDDNLSKALTDWFGENMIFTRWEYVGEINKGDSYLSEVRRIRIHGVNNNDVDRNVQVILKTIPKSICKRLTFRTEDFYRNEIAFYTQVLPALLKFQSERDLKEPFRSNVKLFYAHCDGLNDVICLEDISLFGFRNIVRQKSIDLEHCRMTLKTLAQFHALSYAMKQQEPDEFLRIVNAVSETYWDFRLWNWYKRFWERICKIAIDAVTKEYPDSKYLEKVKEFAVPETYFKMVYAVKDTKNAVISHGDPWTNNFLYKYNNNDVVDTNIIDFQLSRFASPVLDISHFIYNSTSHDLRQKHYNDLLKYYYEVLSNQIKGMGSDPYSIYSWDVFMDEIKKYSFFGLASSFDMLPFIVLDPDDAIDMEIEGDQQVNIDDVWKLDPIKSKEDRLREANNVVHCVDNDYI